MHGGARGPAVFVRYVEAVGADDREACGKRIPQSRLRRVQHPLGKGAVETGDADCHGQFANWPRNDRAFARGVVQVRAAGYSHPALHFDL